MWLERASEAAVGAPDPEPRVQRVLATGGTPRTRAMLARQLAARGIEAHTAEASEATLAAERGAGTNAPYEAVIIDGEPQDTTVVELVRAIRRERLVAPVEIVVLAPLHRVVDIEHALHALSASLLAKPVRPERLWQWLATCAPSAPQGATDTSHQTELDRIALLKARIAGRA